MSAAGLARLGVRCPKASTGIATLGIFCGVQPSGSAESIGYDIIRSTRLEKIRRDDDDMILTVIAAFMEMIE